MRISVRGCAGILLTVHALLALPQTRAQAVLPDDPWSNNTFVDGASVPVTTGLAPPTAVPVSSSLNPPATTTSPPSSSPSGGGSPIGSAGGSSIEGGVPSSPPQGSNPQTGYEPMGSAAAGSASGAQPTGGAGNATSAEPAPRLPVIEKARKAPRNMHIYTLPPFSPMIELSGTGPEAEGWNLSFSHSPWSSWRDDAVALGQPLLSTSLVNASLSVEFVGSAIFFNGTLDGTITITAQNMHIEGDKGRVRSIVTGKPGQVPMKRMMLMGDAQIPGSYNVTLTVTSGSFLLKGIDITAPLGGLG